MIRVWDILTGLCKTSFHFPFSLYAVTGIWLVDKRLIFIRCSKIYVWDIEKEPYPVEGMSIDSQTIESRISGDGSMIFLCGQKSIQAWSVQTGGIVGEATLGDKLFYDHLIVDGSRVWVGPKDSQTQGWDFGIPSSPPVMLSNPPPPKHYLNFVDGVKEQPTILSKVEDTATGKVVFWLSSERHERPRVAQ